jgi:hypothetical protein
MSVLREASAASRRRRLVPFVVVLLTCLGVPLTFAPWRRQVFAPLKIQVLECLIGIGLFAIGVSVVRGRGGGVRLVPSVDLAVAVFGVVNLLAYASSLDRSSSWQGEFPEYQGLATVLAYLAAYLLARVAFTASPGTTRSWPLDALFGALTVTTGVIGGYGILQRLGLDPIWGFLERPCATVGQANSMAAMLVVGLPAVASTYVVRRGWVRWAAAIAGALGLLGLLTSLSRGGWLAALISGGMGLALLWQRTFRGALIGAATFVVIVAVGLATLPSGRATIAQAAERVAAAGHTEATSTAKHLALARIGVAVTFDHPWLGIGQDAFPQVAQRYADTHLPRAEADLLRPRRSESPHNALLSVSSGAGIPALLAYLALLGAVTRRMLAARRSADVHAATVLMIMAGYLVSSLFMTPEVSSTVVQWIVLGAACSAVGPDRNVFGPRPGVTDVREAREMRVEPDDPR